MQKESVSFVVSINTDENPIFLFLTSHFLFVLSVDTHTNAQRYKHNETGYVLLRCIILCAMQILDIDKLPCRT